jgi:NADPH-dependent curcumin reductase CurA
VPEQPDRHVQKAYLELPQVKTREIRLAARPRGSPGPSDFELTEIDLREPAEGEVVVRNLYMSVDPYMRTRMNDIKSYTPPFEVGKALSGAAIGQVVESRSPNLTAGELVSSMQGWREHFVGKARWLERLETTDGVPLTAHLGVLGLTGFTAWYGLKAIGRPKSGETVFVSAASGAVGSVVGQLAKQWGCRTIGSAGSAAKAAYLTGELGFDAAFNYRERSPLEALPELAPDGVDVYFDNVGGDHLEAALRSMRDFGRLVECGMIAGYNEAEPPPGPPSIILVVTRRLLMQGFIILDHWEQRNEFLAEMVPLVTSGAVRAPETVVEGLENAPDAFLDLFRGGNVGKMLVRLAPDADELTGRS